MNVLKSVGLVWDLMLFGSVSLPGDAAAADLVIMLDEEVFTVLLFTWEVFVYLFIFYLKHLL